MIFPPAKSNTAVSQFNFMRSKTTNTNALQSFFAYGFDLLKCPQGSVLKKLRGPLPKRRRGFPRRKNPNPGRRCGPSRPGGPRSVSCETVEALLPASQECDQSACKR